MPSVNFDPDKRLDIRQVRGTRDFHTFKQRDSNGELIAWPSTTTWVFRAEWTGGSLRLSTASGDVTMPTNTEVRVRVSVANSRLLPLGRTAVYELERREGSEEEVEFMGYFTGDGGVNDDV